MTAAGAKVLRWETYASCAMGLAACHMSGLTRYDSMVGPFRAGDMWALQKDGKALRCDLWTHPLGWELRVGAGDEMARTHVCRHEADVFKTAEAWKAEAQQRGWTDQ